MSSIDRTDGPHVTSSYPPAGDTGPAPAGREAGASSATVAQALRILRPFLGSVDAAGGAPLEVHALRAEPPHLSPVRQLEPSGGRDVGAVAGPPLISAFLDGIQRSRVLAHVNATPVIHATTAAVIRERDGRTLRTWRAPVVTRRVLAARAAVGEHVWQALEEAGLAPLELTDGDSAHHDTTTVVHPWSLRARALELVAQERERLERRLAAAWAEHESRWLWMDGGIAGNVRFTPDTWVVGVVKSHTTLYGSASAVRDVLALREGMRSPAFLVGHRARQAVASWYLRLRAPGGHGGDPLFGLVRVEVAPPLAALDPSTWHGDARDHFTTHCDTISAGLLRERTPLSLPDARWDTLAYGVRACETFLHAVIGP